MLKWILIIATTWFVIELFSNLGDMLYLIKTNAQLHQGKHILHRLVHTRDLCYKAGVSIEKRYFEYPDRNYTGISNYIVQAQGEFQHRVLQCLNPIYWIKNVLFLPKKIIEYFGGDPKGKPANIITGIYWIVQIVIQIYPSEVRSIIERVFSLFH